MKKKEIGGYFGLELPKTGEFYPDALKLNSGRNCVKYMILAQKASKLYLPYYIDMGMTEESIRKVLGADISFYHINSDLEIEGELNVGEGEKIVYVNYYSLKKDYISKLVKKYGKNLIVDNTQAFYNRPHPNIDTFYSTDSKYFGVQSGGYMYTHTLMQRDFEYDHSYPRMKHLIGRLDEDASSFYEDYKASMKARYNQDIKKMSKLTQSILASIDYEKIRVIRERNFYYLHSVLKDFNELNFDSSNIVGPMAYPFLFKDSSVREKLIQQKIYVPTYWKYILDKEGPSQWERYLVTNLLPLPIDQRWDLEDMNTVADSVLKEVKR